MVDGAGGVPNNVPASDPEKSDPAVRAVSTRAARWASLLTLALTGLLALGLPVPASQAASAGANEYDPGLSISIDSMNPSYIPRTGVVRMTGEVENVDEVDWVDINVYSFLDDAPMTTSAELSDAVDTDPLNEVGERITTAGTEDKIDLLEPGQTARFSLTIPRSELNVTEAGVYWFGVHALGSSETDPRDSANVADGRARTFIPYIPEATPGSIKTALVIPLRSHLDFTPSGSLSDPDEWNTALSPGGRLRDTVDFGAAAGDRPVSWLVDPALPDAVRRLSTGNGGRSIAPTVSDPSDPEVPPSEVPTDAGPGTDPDAPTPEPSDDSDETTGPLPRDIAPAARAAEDWLNRLESALAGSEVLTLPYGDLDVAAAAEADPGLYERARDRTSVVLTSLGIEPNPAIGAPSGYLNAAGFELVSEETVLATDQMFGQDPPGVAAINGNRVAVTSAGVAAGGPGPGDRLSVVNLRQRLLAEAAVRLVSPGRLPLVVQLPPKWRPAGGTDFFNGLDVDWVDLTTVEDATDREGTTVEPPTLFYPRAQQQRELSLANFTAVDTLTQAGVTLQNLLSRNDRVASAIADQALASLSYGARQGPVKARISTQSARAWVEARLQAVQISTPSGVTLTGDSGEFGAIIENTLDQPVIVDIAAEAEDGQVTVDPIAPILLAAGARTSVNLTAVSTDAGVHNVRLMLTDTDGNPLGSADSLPIRSAQVSGLIWVIMAGGAALLFGAIGLRLVRRIRGERRETRAEAAR